jgi:hypothetical protein
MGDWIQTAHCNELISRMAHGRIVRTGEMSLALVEIALAEHIKLE